VSNSNLKFYVLGTAALLASSLSAQVQRLTAREVVARIQSHVGIPWKDETVDTFKAGNPNTPVTGIAVTMMATLDVLQRAASSGQNLIITHEPTFYNHLDQPDDLPQNEQDPVLTAKRAFIAKHGLVIWRFHDHWHARKPDGIEAGMIHALRWEKFRNPANQYFFVLPDTTLSDLSAYLREKLAIRGPLRVVGDPAMRISRVALVPGASGFGAETLALESRDVDVLITGEPREWETVEYVADARTEGFKKALVILGHIPSEQAGMEECTRWLQTFVKEVPVSFVPASEPFLAAQAQHK
jgi:putative NIF3 family GTP cyclohydrolase 1 type 2